MKRSLHLRTGGQVLQRTEKNCEQKTEMSESSELTNCCTITKFRFHLRKKQLQISKNQIQLDMNDTEILVCAIDDNLNMTYHVAMIQEVLVSCKAYDVEMKERKLSRLR